MKSKEPVASVSFLMDKKSYLKQILFIIVLLISSVMVWWWSLTQSNSNDPEGVMVMMLLLYAIIGFPSVVLNFRFVNPKQKPPISGAIFSLTLLPWAVAVAEPRISIAPFSIIIEKLFPGSFISSTVSG